MKFRKKYTPKTDQQASEEQCQLSLEEKPEEEEQHHEPSIDEKRDQREQLQTEQESNQVEQTNSCFTE